MAARDDARGARSRARSRPSSRFPGAASRTPSGSRTTRRSRTSRPSAACSTARSWRASSRVSGATRTDQAAAARGAAAILAGIADSMQPGLPPRENRREQRTVDVVVGRGGLETVRVSAHGQGAYLQTGLIQAFAAHHLVHADRARSASPRPARPSATGSCSGRSRPTASYGWRSASEGLIRRRGSADHVGRGGGDPRLDA